LQSIGINICSCGRDIQEPSNCSLCEDGSSLPNGLFPGLPGETCAELQVDAIRDFFENCQAHQATFGTYCGCENPVAAANACRVCGDLGDLPDHLRIVETAASGNVSCGVLEFSANLVKETCSDAQGLYAEACGCGELADDPVNDDPSGSSRAMTGLVSVFVSCSLLIVPFLL
jgi:hypothetical protein